MYPIRKETHTHMNKNAYEIRLEVLQLAHSDSLIQFSETINSFRDDKHGRIDPDIIKKYFPKTEDIKKRAEELYSFVSES